MAAYFGVDDTTGTEGVRELFPETWLWTISDTGYLIVSRDGNLDFVSFALVLD